jgi:hypothetical protein
MPSGIRPRVNEAREFLEIAKDFKDSREIIREALSNSWDARASKASLKFSLVPLPGTKRKKIMAEITDDGEGMNAVPRESGKPSEIESFFNLGDSYKPFGSIGSKGHGTKIYYKSQGIALDTWKEGQKIHAETEVPPMESLLAGVVPTYRYEESADKDGKGTRIFVDGFQAKQSEFASLDQLVPYLNWYTVLGSFGQYFNSPRRMDVALKPIDSQSPVTLPYGFTFPDEQPELSQGTDSICKLIGPTKLTCGTTEDGNEVIVEIVGAILGENHRSIVPHTYSHMGLWLCKDYIRVERKNEILEEVFKGQYYYRSMLIFANCQRFDLTANRNNVRTEQEEYDLAVQGIKKFCADLWKDEFVQAFFTAKRDADNSKKQEEVEKQKTERQANWQRTRKERVNRYKGRPNLPITTLKGAPAKEPQNESETALLLQAMISSGHPEIDFHVGEYNTSNGVDLIIEQLDKDMPTLKWAELVHSLDRLYQWPHPPEGYHCVICYQLGNVKETQKFPDGQEARLVPKSVQGKYTLLVGSESIDIYVLRDLLISSATKLP